MSSIGSNGIYRLYRKYTDDHEKNEQRLVGVFAVVGGEIHILEDHDKILEEIIPKGKLNDRVLYRMAQLSQSPYWRLVHEGDIAAGHHPDLLPEHMPSKEE